MGATVSEGMGECNSMESKYRWRWVGERDLPAGTDKTKLVSQERRSAKTGGHWTVYRMDNDDIYSQVNTILKMAKKRALVDAALSAGRLSDVFTQDLEDLPNLTRQEFIAEKPAERARKEPAKQVDNRGEFEKEGRDVLKETLDKPTKKQPEPSPSEPQQVLHPKTEQEGDKGLKRDPATLETITDMYKACHADFGLQPKQVMAELNVNAWSDLTITPAEAYRQIAAVRG